LAATYDADPVRAILLDIEGTTTPINFVFETLFPFARRRLKQFLLEHCDEPSIREDLEALRAQHRTDLEGQLDPPPWSDSTQDLGLESATAYALWLMDRDSKCSPLKSLQGKIWQEGYKKGELRGEVYPDVPRAFDRWSRQGKMICIFSSGSVLAQKLLFGSTAAGDLTGFLRAYFDTTVGPKNARGSYSQIAKTLALDAATILFVSDVVKELDAAREAGMQTILCTRAESTQGAASAHRVIHSFDDALP
jgi:enolase-phosphatase E1